MALDLANSRNLGTQVLDDLLPAYLPSHSFLHLMFPLKPELASSLHTPPPACQKSGSALSQDAFQIPQSLSLLNPSAISMGLCSRRPRGQLPMEELGTVPLVLWLTPSTETEPLVFVFGTMLIT